MKLITGKLAGLHFFMPKDIRPSQNILRKAVFDIFGQDLEGVDFLELYAGSGAVGFEALSCGARSVTFVEKEERCAKVIEGNREHFNQKTRGTEFGQSLVMNTDAFWAIKQLAQMKKKYDIVFLDPPYGHDLAKKTLKTLMAYDILQPNCFVIVQYHKHETLPDLEGRFSLIRERKYGTSFLAIFQGSSPETAGPQTHTTSDS